MQMPILPLDKLSGEALEYANQIINPKTGRLYATRPQKKPGEVQFIWRMVAFSISPKPQHHHIPMIADLYLDGSYNETQQLIKQLSDISDQIVKTVPIQNQPGTIRWIEAFYG